MSEKLKDDSLKKLEELIKIQCTDGNWNYCSYMHGMANGLLCAKSCFTGEDPKYLEAPVKYIQPEINRKLVEALDKIEKKLSPYNGEKTFIEYGREGQSCYLIAKEALAKVKDGA